MFVWEADSNGLLPKLNFTQFLNGNVKIPGRGLCSPSFKDLAWLEDVQLIFLIFHIFACKFGRVRLKKIYRKMYGKFKKVSSATSSKATSFKLGEYSLLPSILTFSFTNFEKFNFGKSYLPCNYCLPVKMGFRQNTDLKYI